MAYAPDPRHTPDTSRQMREQTLQALEETVKLAAQSRKQRDTGASHTYEITLSEVKTSLGMACGLALAFSGDYDSPRSVYGEISLAVSDATDALEVEGRHPREELARLLLAP